MIRVTFDYKARAGSRGIGYPLRIWESEDKCGNPVAWISCGHHNCWEFMAAVAEYEELANAFEIFEMCDTKISYTWYENVMREARDCDDGRGRYPVTVVFRGC